MSAHAVAKRGVKFLDTPVFYAGPSGQEEAIAVFTDRSIAQRYIDQVGWADDHEIGELNELQLLRWTTTAHEQGSKFLTINPDRQSQMAGDRQEVLVIKEKLAAFAHSLMRDIQNQCVE